MFLSNIAVVALIGQAAAAPNWGVSDAAYSASRSGELSSILSSYSSAVAATATAAVNRAVFAEAAAADVLCNAVDDPPYCDFYFPSIVKYCRV